MQIDNTKTNYAQARAGWRCHGAILCSQCRARSSFLISFPFTKLKFVQIYLKSIKNDFFRSLFIDFRTLRKISNNRVAVCNANHESTEAENSAMEKKLNKSTSLQNSHIFDKESDIEMDKFSQAEAALGVWLDNTLTDSSKSITMQLNFSDDFILDIPDDAEVSLFINKNNL